MKRSLAFLLCLVLLALGVIFLLTNPPSPSGQAQKPVAAQTSPAGQMPMAAAPRGSTPPAPLQAAAGNLFAGVDPMVAPARPGAVHVPTKTEEPLPGGPPPLALAPDFLDKIVHGSEQAANFTLPGGQLAVGTVEMLKRDAKGNVSLVQGRLSAPEPGFYFFQKQTVATPAGMFVGNVRFDKGLVAYRAEPIGPGGTPMLVARRLGDVVCFGFPTLKKDGGTTSVSATPPATATAPATSTNEPAQLVASVPASGPSDGTTMAVPQTHPTNIPIAGSQNGVVPLQSLPGAAGVIYLDFDGEKGPFAGWGNFDAAPSNATNAQIKDVWQRIAEDYQAFNINVTTDRNVFDKAPETSRIHVILTPTTTAAPSAGGVAFVGAWNWSGDSVCWSFYSTGKSAADASSHEIGHTLGLSHDGQDNPGMPHVEYYQGQGSGETGWAPIMGVGYYQNLCQWSKGEYANPSNKEDDLSIITNNNNSVDYRADDYGATLATAGYLEIQPNNSVSNEGIIETRNDVDAFRFKTTGGANFFTVTPVNAGPNLDILAEIYDSAGVLVAGSNPEAQLAATVSATLPAGEYTLRVDGVGKGDPLTTGYTDYGTIGAYLITGTTTGGVKPDRLTVAENTANGTAVGTIAPRVGHGTNPLTWAIASGNESGAFSINPANGVITVANSTLLNYEALSKQWDDPATFQLFVTITDGAAPSLNESIRVVVTVGDVNEAPTLTGGSFTMLAHTKSGTALFTAIGSDPDRFDFPIFSILSGNAGGIFAIDAFTGVISAAAAVDVSTPTTYPLVLRATDHGTPALTKDVQVTVTVIPTPSGYTPGTVLRCFYENIGGTGVLGNLTASPKFPDQPDSVEILTKFDADTHGMNYYGSTVRGYLIPPATGNYTFWISSDDQGELRLSPNASPASATVRATATGWTDPHQYTKYASQKTAVIALTAGQPYYIEARQAQGNGGDHLAVAWQGPNIAQQVIPGRFLVPFSPNYAPIVPAATLTVRKDAYTGSSVGMVAATDGNAEDTLSFAIAGGNNAGIFGIDAATGRLFVANNANLSASAATSYALQIKATDNSASALSGTGKITVNVAGAGVITADGIVQQIWTGIAGATVADLTSKSAVYPNLPTTSRVLSSFDTGANYGDNYGSRIRACVVPPTTGSYKFYIASDDASQLRFNTAGPTPAVTQVAGVSTSTLRNVWTGSSQVSPTYTLTAGQSYYIETIHKEGAGADFVQVAWTGPDIATPTIIPGTALKPFDINVAPVWSGAPYAFTTSVHATNGTLVGTVSANDPEGGPRCYAILGGNAAGAFAMNSATGAITVVNAGALPSGQVVNLTVGVQDDGIAGVYPLKSASTTVAITVQSKLDLWRIDQFGADAGNSLIAGNLADPDGDGLNNLLEYALGLPPRANGPSGIVVDAETIGAETYLRLTTSKNPDATDVALRVEVTGNLKDSAAWTSDGTTVEIDTASTLRVRDNTPFKAFNSRFIRLKATIP